MTRAPAIASEPQEMSTEDKIAALLWEHRCLTPYTLASGPATARRRQAAILMAVKALREHVGK